MRLIVIGSGSSGNSYALMPDSGKGLAIEAGIRFADFSRAIDYRTSDIEACIVSHSHGDHATHAGEFAKRGIPVFTTSETAGLMASPLTGHFFHTVEPGRDFTTDEWRVLSLSVRHDVPCLAFVAEHRVEGKRVAFVTDTMSFPYVLPPCDVIMMEANYSDELLDASIMDGTTPPSMRARLMESHMEVGTAIKALALQHHVRLAHIVLVHLSSRHADPDGFRRMTEQATGVPTTVARKGVTVDF